MIRVMLGFLIVFGSIGSMDFDPDFPVWQGVLQSVIGLAIMYWGVKKVSDRGGFDS